MNIRDILTQSGSFGKDETGAGFRKKSMLAVGKKGQVVEGVVKNVSDRISISFNGVEVAVPHTAVQNATEGETRQFRIMDVSKDNIVLKEVENNAVSKTGQAGHSMVSTEVSSSSYSYKGQVSDSAKTAETINDRDSNIKVLTGDDYEEIQGKEGSFEECRKESVERIVKRIKEQKAYQQYCKEQGDSVREDLQQGLEQMQAVGFIDGKSESQIRAALADADIPVTDANIASVVTALQMSQTSSYMSDDAKAYIISNDMAPTISNIYHGQYSGSDAESGFVIDEETWQQILPQVESAISASGVEKDTALVESKWLFANDLPITADAISKLDVLNDIEKNMSPDVVLKQIIQAMAAGNQAENASLDTAQFTIARKYIQEFMSVNDNDIATAVRNMGQNSQPLNLAMLMAAHDANSENENTDTNVGTAGSILNNENTAAIPNVITGIADEEMARQITARRQVAEICLRMTMSSVGNMAAKGIDIETSPLEDIVDALREEENTYYKAQFADNGIALTDDELNIMQETMQKTSDIAGAPAAILGGSVRQQNLITLNELHSAAISETYQRNLFSEVYEQVATQADSYYGDSIEKAFESIPDILKELGLKETDANKRAVRILGYNGMEITTDNISGVKEYDAMVNRVISNMKPAVVLNMIREGNNPLDTAITDLDDILTDMSEKVDISEEEKYSRYLWKLEKTSSIDEKERDGYIGIYRLLNSIEKTDGAAIGAVINADKDMTLANLLTAVRTIKGSGIDVEVNKEFAGVDSTDYNGKSITSQINNGFSQENTIKYYDSLVSDTLDEITPSKVQQISDGDMNILLDSSIETIAESMKKASGNREIEKAYYEEQAQQIRDVAESSEEAEEFLANMGIPDSIANLNAAQNMLQNGYSVIKDAYNRRNILDRDDKEAYEDIIEDMPEMLIDDDTIQKQCEKADNYMEEILSKSYKTSDADIESLEHLKLLGQGIRLNGSLARQRSYEIPIVAGDEIKTMNVTILNGYDDNGKVQVTMNDDELGKISVQLRLSGDDIKGLVISDSRDGYEKLDAAKGEFEDRMKEAGFNVKNISVGMERITGNNILKKDAKQESADTSKLYKAAKITVRYISSLVS